MALFNLFSSKKKPSQEQVQEAQDSLNQGLVKTKENFLGRLSRAVAGRSKIDSDFLDELEDILISSDVGIDTTVKIIERVEARISRDKYMNSDELMATIKNEITLMFEENHSPDTTEFFTIQEDKKPYVMMVVGVNGVGKTTTIGKLSSQIKSMGLNVVLGAADTFRAAAIEQLKVWGERVDVPVIYKEMGADPASVAFDTLNSAVSRNADVVIIDTAGRLHNKVNLMNELSKIKNVMKKVIPDAPHEVILVLDASTGQNAIEQAKQFIAATEVTGLAITKLDGTAKGGVVLGITSQFKIPIKYIGVGEKVQDLQVFNRAEFVEALFSA